MAHDRARELRAALQRNGWNISQTAAELGLSRFGLYKQMRRLGVKTTAAERRRTISAINRESVLIRHRRRRRIA